MNGCKEDNVMKRLSIIAVTAIAALLSASCNKSIETPMAPAPQGSIILDLNILGFDGAGDTKALKNGWVAGDKLNLWFDDWNFNEKVNNPTPDLVITYDGSKWTAGELAAGRSLKPNGKFSVVYEGFNDLTKYESKFEGDGQFYGPPSDLFGGLKVRQNNIVYYKYYLDYTYNYADNKLKATISDWNTYSGVKIRVKGLNPKEAANYILNAKNITANEFLFDIAGFSIDPEYSSSGYYPHVYSVIGSYSGYVLGVPDTDGVAFYYRDANFTNAEIEFRLFEKKAASGKFEEADKAAKFTGKTLVTDGKKIFGIVIDKSKFE